MARIGKISKAAVDAKHYTIDYAAWLDPQEQLSTVTFAVAAADGAVPVTPLTVTAITLSVDKLSVAFLVSGGDLGHTYNVYPTAVTTGGQTKEDSLFVVVGNP